MIKIANRPMFIFFFDFSNKNMGPSNKGSRKKVKLFQKMSLRPSVRPCAKVMYTKTQERIKIIEFFCLKGVYWESKLLKFRPERTKAYEVRAE